MGYHDCLLRTGLPPAHHSEQLSGIHDGCFTMLDCSALRFRRLCDVRDRLVWRPLPRTRTALRFQRRPRHHWSSYPCFAGNGGVRYFGVFLATAGANANIPVAMSYQANNIRGQWKRAFRSAPLVGFGALGGIVGTTTFRSEDRPHYVPGISVAIGSQVLILILVGFLTLDFKRQNGKADRGEKVLEEGDEHFRYTY